jgi:acyl-coenzyme A synthetase/AMP-(fatty) acid ligase
MQKIPVEIIDLHSLPRCELHSKVPTTEPNDDAYVVFTSGSTGRPKGVRISRRAFSYFVGIAQGYFCARHGERWAQFSNLGYDIAVMDTFMALCHGAALVTISSATEKIMPGRAIKKNRINIWQSVPSAIELLLKSDSAKEDLATLRTMSFCGEPLLSSQVEAIFDVHPSVTIFNTYGTTETTGFNTLKKLTQSDYRAACQRPIVALGTEVPGWSIILEGGSKPDEGEIVVFSDYLSLGYWGDEEGTKASFREYDDSENSLRAYSTGDWGEREGEQLHFRGRIDRQIKIKGERIELDEIDYRLREQGFQIAASILEDGAIYSFVETESPVDESAIRNQLGRHLPFHAVPRRVLAMHEIPRNTNGKIAYPNLRQLLPKRLTNG